MQDTIKKILDLSEMRINYLHNVDDRGFYKGNKTYIKGLYDEIDEMKKELRENNSVYLEDELGDIFWDFVCLLNSLEQEKKINKDNVFKRCCRKFSERISFDGTNAGNWNEVKQKQKQENKEEHDLKYSDN